MTTSDHVAEVSSRQCNCKGVFAQPRPKADNGCIVIRGLFTAHRDPRHSYLQAPHASVLTLGHDLGIPNTTSPSPIHSNRPRVAYSIRATRKAGPRCHTEGLGVLRMDQELIGWHLKN